MAGRRSTKLRKRETSDLALTAEAREEVLGAGLAGLMAAGSAWVLSRAANGGGASVALGTAGAILGGIVGQVVGDAMFDPETVQERRAERRQKSRRRRRRRDRDDF